MTNLGQCSSVIVLQEKKEPVKMIQVPNILLGQLDGELSCRVVEIKWNNHFLSTCPNSGFQNKLGSLTLWWCLGVGRAGGQRGVSNLLQMLGCNV